MTGSDLRTVDDGKVPIRLLTLPIGDAANPVGWLQTGFVLTLHERQSASLVVVVTLVGLVGLAGAALVTLFVTGRALVPIRAAIATERRFVADASHEIRTPAAIIRASAEVLDREGLVTDDGRPLVADIVAESDRLGGLVDDLLALAASERGSLTIERRQIDLAAVARDTTRRAGPLAAERGVDLVGPRDDGRALPVIGDPDRLVQVLLILVDNALRHSPPGGRVTLTAGPVPGRGAAVSVDDQGPGVPTIARETIFEPFARLPGSRARADAGSGLGLAIARRLVELHGGTLIATDAPGGGARFVVSLPAVRSGGVGAVVPDPAVRGPAGSVPDAAVAAGVAPDPAVRGPAGSTPDATVAAGVDSARQG